MFTCTLSLVHQWLTVIVQHNQISQVFMIIIWVVALHFLYITYAYLWYGMHTCITFSIPDTISTYALLFLICDMWMLFPCNKRSNVCKVELHLHTTTPVVLKVKLSHHKLSSRWLRKLKPKPNWIEPPNRLMVRLMLEPSRCRFLPNIVNEKIFPNFSLIIYHVAAR